MGSRVCAHLRRRQEGVTVRALVRRRTDWLDVDDQVVVEDLASPKALDQALDGIGSIVHLSGSNEVVAARSPSRALADTVIGTQCLVEAASAVPRFVYLSTVHVYGRSLEPGRTIDEGTLPEPLAVYGIARLAAEQIANARPLEADGSTVVLRLTNSVGAPAHPAVDRWTLIANDLCRQAAVVGELELRSDGSQWRDFVPLGDVCSLLGAVALGALSGGTYNVGSGEPMTVRRLAELVQDVAERRLGRRPALKAPTAATSPAPYVISVDKLASAGFALSHDIDGAIDETLRFCLEWKDRLDP